MQGLTGKVSFTSVVRRLSRWFYLHSNFGRFVLFKRHSSTCRRTPTTTLARLYRKLYKHSVPSELCFLVSNSLLRTLRRISMEYKYFNYLRIHPILRWSTSDQASSGMAIAFFLVSTVPQISVQSLHCSIESPVHYTNQARQKQRSCRLAITFTCLLTRRFARDRSRLRNSQPVTTTTLWHSKARDKTLHTPPSPPHLQQQPVRTIISTC